MKWVAVFGSGLVAAVSGTFYGFFASLGLASWLRVPSFEGAFGYFVIYGAFLAFVVSFICGVVTGCLLIGSGGVGFVRAAMRSMLLACGLITVAAAIVALAHLS